MPRNSKATSLEKTETVRFVENMSERVRLAEKFRKEGYDCSVAQGVIQFYIGLERADEIQQLLQKNGYDASWGVYPARA